MKLANIFQNGAVLQQNKPLYVWGEDFTGNHITVTLNGISAGTKVINGHWKVVLPSFSAATGLTMEVQNNLGQQIILKDIAIGEVWIAGGQSNMEFLMKWDSERKDYLDSYNNPTLRFYEVPKLSYPGQEQDEDHSHEGLWRKAIPGDTAFFSAVGFYFARKVQTFLANVPVGIIGCNWGGTSASAWMTDEYLDNDLLFYVTQRESTKHLDLAKEFTIYKQVQHTRNTASAKADMDRMMQTPLTAPMKMELPPEEIERFMRTKFAPFSPFRAAGLYKTMLSKIIPYSAAGVIWYQGEEDAARADVYAHLLSNMIQCWRDSWHEELPFLITQLTTYTNPEGMQLDFTEIRAVQEYVTKTVPNVYLSCTMDVGLEFDIHPKLKRPVGERMALQAIHHVYGGDIISESPEVTGAWKEAGKIIIQLLHCGDGLYIQGDAVQSINITVNGKIQKNAEAIVDGDKMIILCDAVTADSRILIAFQQKDYCCANVFSSVGLPVRPFIVRL